MYLFLFSTKDDALFYLLQVFSFLIFSNIFKAYLFSVHFHRNIFHNISFFIFHRRHTHKGWNESNPLDKRKWFFVKQENLFSYSYTHNCEACSISIIENYIVVYAETWWMLWIWLFFTWLVYRCYLIIYSSFLTIINQVYNR